MNKHNITSASRIFISSKLQLGTVDFFLLSTQISCTTVGKDLGIFRSPGRGAHKKEMAQTSVKVPRINCTQTPTPTMNNQDATNKIAEAPALSGNNSCSQVLSVSNSSSKTIIEAS